MSQLGKNLLAAGKSLQQIQTEDAQFVTPIKNRVFVLGSLNISTSASGNTITAALKPSIEVDSATIGDITISSNTIATSSDNTPINIDPDGTGKLEFPDEAINAVLITDNAGKISSTTLTNGQILIGSTGNEPVAATLTAGTGISIINGSNSITIASSGSGGGGLLEWEYYSYTGSEQLHFDLPINKGIITNSIIATPSNPGYCPLSNFVFTVPDSVSLTAGDSFWVANKGIGSVLIEGSADQYWITVGYDQQLRPSVSYRPFNTVFLALETSSQGSMYKEFLYLSTYFLVYVGEVRQMDITTGAQTTYDNGFAFAKMVGIVNWIPVAAVGQPGSCYQN